jgi:hypothetical protein
MIVMLMMQSGILSSVSTGSRVLMMRGAFDAVINVVSKHPT